MPSQPIPFGFQLYFYTSIVIAALFSLVAVVLYRRVVRQNMVAVGRPDAVSPTITIGREAAVRVHPAGPMVNTLQRRLALRGGSS